jgi:uncharacterized membrane protein
LWISISVILSLWSLLSYWRTSKTRFLFGVFLFHIVGIAFKEMAYITPLPASLLLWNEWKKAPFPLERRHWLPIITLLVVVVLAYGFRTWALQGPGFRFGSNGSWLTRWFSYVWGGRPVYLFFAGQVASASVVFTILGFAGLGLKKWKISCASLLVGLSLMLWSDWNTQEAFGVLTQFLAFWSTIPVLKLPIVRDSLLSLIVIVMWVDFLIRRDRRQIFGFSWVLLSYIPLMTAPITEHALYLPSMGWGIFFMVALDNLFRSVRGWWSQHRTAPAPS